MRKENVRVVKTKHNKILYIIICLLICLITVFICLIGVDSIKTDKDQEVVDDAPETSDNHISEGSEVASEPKPKIEEYSKNMPTKEADQDALEYNSLLDFFKDKDPNWNGSEEYQAAVSAYNEAIGQNTIDGLIEQRGGVGEARFVYAYIDEDDIPELLLGLGDFHTSGICVLKYDPYKKDIAWLGDFSSFGGIGYVEHGNRIISQYGSGGLYMIIVSTISGDKVASVGSVTNEDSRNYYAGYALPNGADGSHKDSYGDLSEGTGANPVKVDFPDETYLVTEEEYNKAYSELLGGEESSGMITYVDYDSSRDDVIQMEKVRLKPKGKIIPGA